MHAVQQPRPPLTLFLRSQFGLLNPFILHSALCLALIIQAGKDRITGFSQFSILQ